MGFNLTEIVNKKVPVELTGSKLPEKIKGISFPKNILTGTSYFCFPSIDIDWNGKLWCVYRKGTGHVSEQSTIELITSTDNGLTWSAATVLATASAGQDVRDPSIYCDRAKNIFIVSYFIYDTVNSKALSVHTLRSGNGGSTWAAPVTVPTGFTTEQACSHKAVSTGESTWALPVYGKNTGDSYYWCKLMVSTNDGVSWSVKSTMAALTTYSRSEPTILVVGNKILAVIRRETQFGEIFESPDYGVTWNYIGDTGFVSHCPQLFMSSGGKLLLGYRTHSVSGGEARGNFLATSPDLGKTWNPLSKFSNVGNGYPEFVEYDTGKIAMVFDNVVTGSVSYLKFATIDAS